MNRDHLYLRLAVDLAILTVRDGVLNVLAIERAKPPFQDQAALPGGFLREGEDLVQAAWRELREETALDGETLHLEQLGIFGAPDRDPRGRVVSVAYLALAPNLPVPTAGSDASAAQWRPVADVTGCLAFDHDEILAVALERARSRLEFTTLATAFCDKEFTMGDLREVYQVVWGEPVDPRNFSRKVLNTEGFVEPSGGRRAQDTGRPAALYRRGPAARLNPPILRHGTDRSSLPTP
ncbi:NUDIX hydrolase [Catellatospora sp. TT07R-123]|uniref:NUDIX hydrolase n=1 Tax=Catellatospora sp. TT07R-123 TaxID=2733863 RepID=UPI001B013789|nr:NUDIX domain-containing protein [Catellatospora sp. TT07R-123]GHJ47720.1 NUDIX hydrolase [Catellatospora sp. TT07R-123]